MRKLNNSILLILFSFATVCVKAQMSQYNYKRHLQTNTDTWQKIILPNDVFGKLSASMNDLRIYGIQKNGDTVTAPYLLFNTNAKEASKEVSFKLINKSIANGGFYYTFETNAATAINEIDLSFSLANFDARAKLEGSQDQKQWFTLLDGYRLVSIKNDYTNYQFTKLLFGDAKYHYYRLFVSNNTNPQFQSAELLLHTASKDSLANYKPKTVQVRIDKAAKETIIDIDLGLALPVNSIKLLVQDTFDYYRPAEVQYLSDSFKTATGWQYNYLNLTSATLSKLEHNEINFETTIAQRLRVVIENGDNAPLKINTVLASGVQYYLMARFTESADFYLVYGNAKADKPDYDIEHFVASIPQNAVTVNIAEEEPIAKQAIAKTKQLFENKAWLWAVMAAIILLLAGFSFSMLKKVK